MCDDQTIKDWEQYLKNKPVSRRKFNILTAGAGLSTAIPSIANAQNLSNERVSIQTPDGNADCFMVHPANGTYPGVLLWTDVLSLRPAYEQMASRLAAQGYAVLVPNPYYRSAPAPVVEAGASFQDQATRDIVLPMAGRLNAQTHVTDAIAFIDFLDNHSAVDTERPIGTMGYCMGGPIVFRTAAARPDRIGAVASFHGGGLATDADNSPHRLIPGTEADFLIAIAENDDANDPDAKNVLRDSFEDAGKNAEVEVYDGALHGWTVLDSRVYHEEQAERAWGRLLALFDNALG